MQIKGKKYLDANWYDKIVIMERNGDIECNVKNNSNVNSFIKSSYTISDTLNECKDDYERVLELVNYFLRYGIILKVEDNIYIPNIYSNKFIKITTKNRELYLSINPNKYGSKMINNILNKYYFDRNKSILDSLDEDNMNFINIRFGKNMEYDIADSGFYDIENDRIIKTGNKSISIIDRKNNKEEQIFMTSIMNNIANDGFVYFTEMLETTNDFDRKICGFKLQSNHYTLCSYNLDLIDTIKEMVNNHNREYREQKGNQLKIEYLIRGGK